MTIERPFDFDFSAFFLPIEEILGRVTASPTSPAGARDGAFRIGTSRQGRPLFAYRFGTGPLNISLIGGCHADEPVGPAMLDALARWLRDQPGGSPALRAATWHLVPRVNPDGDEANSSWSELPPLDEGYDLGGYLDGAVREAPGEDVEFGFPRYPGDTKARPENRAVAAFLSGEAFSDARGGDLPLDPYHLHATFHGMAFAAGPWFLLESRWLERSRPMREALTRRVRELGYDLHGVDRGGEKGFWRISDGFTTRPDSRMMRDFFLARGETDVAARFRPSSMEFVGGLGGDPLTLVSEMPLFLYPLGSGAAPREAGESDPPLPTSPEPAQRFVAWARRTASEGGPEALAEQARRLGVVPMPIGDQMRLQLAMLEEGLRLVERYREGLGSTEPSTVR